MDLKGGKETLSPSVEIGAEMANSTHMIANYDKMNLLKQFNKGGIS